MCRSHRPSPHTAEKGSHSHGLSAMPKSCSPVLRASRTGAGRLSAARRLDFRVAPSPVPQSPHA